MRVASAASGYDVKHHHYVEINGASAKVVKHWFPDAIHEGDIRPLAEDHQGYARQVWGKVSSWHSGYS